MMQLISKRPIASWLLTLAIIASSVFQRQSPRMTASATQYGGRPHPFYKHNVQSSSILSSPCWGIHRPTSLALSIRGGSDPRRSSSSSQPTPPYNYGNRDQGSRYREAWETPREEPGQYPERDPYATDYYDDRGLPSPRETNKRKRMGVPLPDIVSRGNRKVGVPLLAAGVAVTMLGMSLFFNKTLMRLGNLLFISGVCLSLGPSRTMGYFMQAKKARATACLVAGIFLVFIGWPIIGIVLELFGLLNLFGNMFPLFWAVAKQMPIIGNLLQQSGGDRKSRRKPRYYDDADDMNRRKREEEEYY